MATLPKGGSWKEHNKIHKEQRKKWREERLIKKANLDDSEQEEEEDKFKDIEPEDTKKELSTVSIAVPGSILDNAQSAELRTYLAGQIARAACIYKIDEVIVFDDLGDITEVEKKKLKKNEGLGEARPGCLQLARILQYLECPQYLRKHIFPLHNDLQYAGVLNPLDAPHHLRQQDICLYREGITTQKPPKSGKGSFVNIGLKHEVLINTTLQPGYRVTVKIPPNQENPKKMYGIVVSPKAPKLAGIYWGYTVRLAKNLSDIFAQCPYKGGYNMIIGTSDKGEPIDSIADNGLKYNHALIVFGGLAGLEVALKADPKLDVEDPSLLFQYYLNTCPKQGSRTIRTEEAILVSLAELRTKLSAKNPTPDGIQLPQTLDKA